MIVDIGYFIVLFWFLIGVMTLIIEATTTELVSIWFVIGAFVAMIFSAILPNEQIWQIIIFVVVSGITLGFVRPFAKKRIFKNDSDVDTNTMIGLKGVATTDISSLDGHVMINGTSWSAVAVTPIKAGSKIEIVKQDNLILTVKEIIE